MNNEDLNKGIEELAGNTVSEDGEEINEVAGTTAGNIMDMSSEDYEAMKKNGGNPTDTPTPAPTNTEEPTPAPEPEPEPEPKPEIDPTTDLPVETPKEEPKEEPKPEEAPKEEPKPEETPAPTETPKEEVKPEAKTETQPEETPKEEPKAETKTETTGDTVDYKAEIDKLTAPFKADGVELRVANVDEARTLMSKGVAWDRQNREFAPFKGAMKALQKNNLLNPDTVNLIVDALANKNPKALAKIAVQAGIDPAVDLDMTEAGKYTSPNVVQSAQVVSVTEALDRVKAIPEGKALLADMHANWDEESKGAIGKDPDAVLDLLVEHKKSGLYDELNTEIQKQRLLGNMNGVPFLKVYYDLATERLKSAEASNPDTPKDKPDSSPTTAKPAAGSKPKDDAATFANDEAASAASTVAKSAGEAANTTPNVLDMSSEEYAKLRAKQGQLVA